MCLQCIRLIKTNLAGNTTVLKLVGNINQPVYTEQSIQVVLEKLPKCPAMKALEDLTPQGSEFWEDAAFCYKFVHDKLTWLHHKVIEQQSKSKLLPAIGMTVLN